MTMSRRQFMTGTAAGITLAATGCATTATTAKTAVLHRRAMGANDRIRCAFIGIGNRAGSILQSTLPFADVDVVAVADTYDTNRAKALAACKTKCANATEFVRFEEMLEKTALDCVVIGTPDHVHAPAILAALDAGLDVYTEKPMTLTWETAKKVRDRARAAGVARRKQPLARLNAGWRAQGKTRP